MRWCFVIFTLVLAERVVAESCDTLDATYGIYSADELKVESGVSINGNSVDDNSYSAHGIETGGNVVAANPDFPELDPSSFPANSSDTEIDSDDTSSISSGTEVFFKKIEVKKNDTLSITGDGPFHIEEFKVEQGASVTLDSGTFYIGKFDIEKNGRLLVNSAVRLHIDEELKIEQGFGANMGGNPADLVIFLHPDAKFEIKKNAVFSGVVYGDQNGDVKLSKGVDFTGSLVSDGKVEIEKNVNLNLSSNQQTSIGSVSTCNVSGGGGGDSGSSLSCDAIPAEFASQSGSDLRVSDRVTINGSTISKSNYGADASLNLDGSVSTSAFSLPTFDPEDFPDNTATDDLDEGDSPLDGSSAVSFDKITVNNDQTFTFTGSGPFHIDELEIRDRATVNFSAGVYYINKVDGKNDGTINAEYPTRVHISDEFVVGDRFAINTSGDPQDLMVFLYENSKFETKNDAQVSAVVLGLDNEKVKLNDRTEFTGLILSDGKVELKNDVVLNLSSEQLARIGQESTCANSSPESSVSYFVIGHDGSGINCLGEIITVTAVDELGDPVTEFAEQVTLDTQTGNGTFVLLTGDGTFAHATSNDGLAIYTFSATDQGAATFTLNYQEGANSFDLDVFLTSDSAIRDDDTEGNLVFAPSGFTVTQAALSNPPPGTINDPIATQTAGSNFDIHLAAFGESPTDGTCGIIEDYNGPQALSFWVDYDDPGTGTIVPSVAGSGIAASEGGASSQSILFTDGQASVSVKYKDVGRIQIEMKDGDIRGATTPFVVLPADLVITAIVDGSGTANPAANSMVGTAFVAAGEAFTVQVEVRDSEGSLTPNFGNESAAEGLTLTSVSLVAPAGGFNGSANDGSIGNGTNFSPVTPAGIFENTNVSWNETGVIQMQASITDGSYLGAGDVSGTISGNVGRFRPNEFAFVAGAVSGSCGNRTYMAEPGLAMSYQVEARGVAGNALRNYDTALAGVGSVAGLSVVAENANNGIDVSGRLSVLSSNWVNGVRSVASSTESFSRLSTVDGPYSSLQLGLRLTDMIDGLNLPGLDMQATSAGDCAAAGTCNARSLGGATELYYGRLEVQNAFGSETEALEVGMRTTLFNGTSFVVNTQDNCFAYRLSEVTLNNYQDGLPVVSVLSPSSLTNLSSGVTTVGAGLFLSSPGATNTGSVDVTYDAPAWLEFDWLGSGLQDPTGNAIFGQFRGHDKVIYWREVY